MRELGRRFPGVRLYNCGFLPISPSCFGNGPQLHFARSSAPRLRLPKWLRSDGRNNGYFNDKALLLIGFASGMRRSELAALEVYHPQIQTRPDYDRPQGGDPVRGKEETYPVRALHHWLDIASLKSGKVFRSVDTYRFVMATDMGNPPGVTILRKGDLSAIRLSEKSSSLSALRAKPDKIDVPGPSVSLPSGSDGSISNSEVIIVPRQLAQ